MTQDFPDFGAGVQAQSLGVRVSGGALGVQGIRGISPDGVRGFAWRGWVKGETSSPCI